MKESDKKTDFPQLWLDKTKVKVVHDFDDSDEIEYWRNTSYEERLEHLYRLRRMAYGDQVRGRIQRIIEIVER